ncbi:MAG: N-acetylmuramoyl-L-alanine amidase [Pseudonocardiales bacterium]|nr:N-acetylmuramoyl-L-alanine amidase [Pseudonocardiales bacterium]
MTPVTPARRTTLPLLAVLAVLLAGCGGEPVQPAPTASVTNPSAADSAAPAAPAAPAVKRTVLLDPGHNGGNATHSAEINKKVPDGRGGTKPCNTTGTSTDAGYPEHKFNWDVALRVGELLLANGVNAKLTRTDDTGVGPCVDVRGEMAAKMNVDAEISIHADGAAPAGYGFHVAYPRPALNTAQGAPSLALASALRDALHGSGLPESTYIGKSGLFPRSDLAGLNTSKRPIALVECANMRNPKEAVTVSNPVGRARYAQAITVGILAWLATLPPVNSAAAKHTDDSDSGTDSSDAGSTDAGSTGTSGAVTHPSSGTGAKAPASAAKKSTPAVPRKITTDSGTSGGTGTGTASSSGTNRSDTTDSASTAPPRSKKPAVPELSKLGGSGGPLGG